jgi:hypothetical protein
MAARQKISVDQFGDLFHGTSSAADATDELAQHVGGHRYSAMQKSFGWNYATTSKHEAWQYADDAAQSDTRRTGVQHHPRVFQVQPKRRSETWGPDPDSGPNGFNDGPANKRDALDYAENGSPVSLRFRSPLRVVGGLVRNPEGDFDS